MTENITQLPLPCSIVVEDIESPSIYYEKICLVGAKKGSGIGLKKKGNIESFKSDSLLCEKLDNLSNELISNNSILQQHEHMRSFRSPNDISPGKLAIITKGHCNSVNPMTPLNMESDLRCSEF